VLTEDAALVCEPFLDFCLDSWPKFDEVTCDEIESVVSAGYCRYHEMCDQSIQLTPDVRIADRTEQETDCFQDGACTCWFPGSNFSFPASTTAFDAGTCPAASRTCRD
jgi:hypothetical protein